MKYYYEIKEKSGCIVGGHNLEVIEFCDNCIRLFSVLKQQLNIRG